MKNFIVILLLIFLCYNVNSQEKGISIGKEGKAPHPKSILDIESNERGILIPRLTTEERLDIFYATDQDAIGLLVFDIDLKSFMVWDGKNWLKLKSDIFNEMIKLENSNLIFTNSNGINTTLDMNKLINDNINDGIISATKLSSEMGKPGQILALDSDSNFIWVDKPQFIIEKNSISNQLLENNIIDSDKIKDFSINASKLNVTTPLTYTNTENGKVLSINFSESTYKLEWINLDVLSKIPEKSIENIKLANNTITNEKLTIDAIKTNNIEDKAIVNSKIGNQAIDSINIAEQAVKNIHINNHSITANKLSALEPTQGDILVYNSSNQLEWVTQTSASLGFNTVSSFNIKDGEIETIDLNNLSITNEKIANNTITNEKLTENLIKTNNIEDSAITNQKIENNAIDSAKINGNSIKNIHITDSIITSNKIALEAIDSTHISNDAIHNQMIINNSITNEKLTDNSVSTNNIIDKSITGNKLDIYTIDSTRIDTAAITTIKIADKAISNEKMNADAINTINIINNSVTLDKIADNSIDSAKLIENSIKTIHVDKNAITANKLSAKEPEEGDILTYNSNGDLEWITQESVNLGYNSITSYNIENGEIRTNDLSDLSITTIKVADKAITNDKIEADAIKTNIIEDGAIINSKIADNAIDSAKIMNNTIKTIHINNKAITNDKIETDAIKTNIIENGAIINSKIADNAIDSAKIMSNAIKTIHINNKAITNDKIKDGAIIASKLSNMGATKGQILSWNDLDGEGPETNLGWMPKNMATIGDIKQSIVSSDHDGWLICNGTTITAEQYAKIQAANLTAVWAQMGGSSTKRPDLRDRVLAMKNGHTLGSKNGNNNYTLSYLNLPNHDHKITIKNNSETKYTSEDSHSHTTNTKSTHTDYSYVNNNHIYYFGSKAYGKLTLWERETQGGDDMMVVLEKFNDSNLTMQSSYHRHPIDIPSLSMSTDKHNHSLNLNHSHTVYTGNIRNGSAQSSFDLRQPTAYINHFIFVGE